MEGGFEEMGEKVEGIKRYKLSVIKIVMELQDKYSIGSTVNNTVFIVRVSDGCWAYRRALRQVRKCLMTMLYT